MLAHFFNAITALGSGALQNVLASAGERFLQDLKNSKNWEKVIVGTGDFWAQFEKNDTSFFKDIELVLSKENLSQIAKDLKADDGYELKSRLFYAFMRVMQKYDIPYEIAESYTVRIIYAVLEQLRIIDPEKYEHYFLQDWRDEQEKSFSELQKRIDKISDNIITFSQERVAIESSGQIDINLRRSTESPSIGIDFFVIDDEHFKEEFVEKKSEEKLYIRGRNREETIYCILNELWRLDDRRPIYVVKNLESWNKLGSINGGGNIYIPWFCADEIVAIENNTNIFVLDENEPVFGKRILDLRPRTLETISKCLQDAGMEYSKAYALLSDTHGLYSQIKKQLFRGEYLKVPSWMDRISDRAKKTCLLVESWEEIEGDKLIIETIYGDSYDKFLGEIRPYCRCEDPFLFVIKQNGVASYYLASAENVWSYLDVDTCESIWDSFTKVVLEVINESENLFTYDNRERLISQIKGESLFWSETIRKGMLKTLLIKGAYKQDKGTQNTLDMIVEEILACVKNEKQWRYISKFWRELCEISPTAVLNKLNNELNNDTGLFLLFHNQSNDFLFTRNAYIDILWGVEQFLSQKEYFWSAFRWLINLDHRSYEYKSNSPEDIFSKVYCTWMNFTTLQNASEKISAAEIAFGVDGRNTWDYLYSAIGNHERSIVGGLSSPKYRDHVIEHVSTIGEMQKTAKGYLSLLLKHMDFSADRWRKMVRLSDRMSKEERKNVFNKLLYELGQMTDADVIQIKNEIRNIIFKHRYYASSGWAMPEEVLIEYEELLPQIKVYIPEYEYVYLFLNSGTPPLLHPTSYDCESRSDANEIASQQLIEDKLKEFQKEGYDLKILASVCANNSFSSLGKYLSMFWNDGKWEYDVFKLLLEVQESGNIAIDYLKGFNGKELIPFEKIITDLSGLGCSTEVLAKIYREEARTTQDVPLITNASKQIKEEFWKDCIWVNERNSFWSLSESKKYATLDVYLNQIHRIHYYNPLTAEQIYSCLMDIGNMNISGENQMTGYHLEQLLGVIQNAYINDDEKCFRICQIELVFMNLLDWKNMKCFRRVIKQSPELYAQIVKGVFKKDHESSDTQQKDQTYIHNMYTIYEKAHFCPAEKNGKVSDEDLEAWVEKYRELLISNDQESLFTTTLGRLFSFSPIGIDKHEPCEAVRMMIEKYGDDKMVNHYQTAVYNRRGIFSPTAGKAELKMAEGFRENALYLDSQYPKTAKIYYGLSETYKRESERERMDAENGW